MLTFFTKMVVILHFSYILLFGGIVMQKKIHLIGEVDMHSIDLIVEQLKLQDDTIECKYIEETRDLQLNTNNKDILDIINHIIEELTLNIKTVERKRGRKPSNVEFEKRVFLFSDLKSVENGVFLVSYLLNDSQIREARFDYRQKILTVETTDPFIFNKISKVVSAFGEDITITESYSKEKTFDIALMYRFFFIALLLFSVALVTVTLEEPTALSFIAWIVVYTILAFRSAKATYHNFLKKQYFESVNFVILGSLLMFIYGYRYEASLSLFVYQSANTIFRDNYSHLVNRLVKQMDKTVENIRVLDHDVYVDKQVEEVEKGDVILLNQNETCLFEGKITDGQVTIDTLLMDGNKEKTICQVGDMVSSGAKIIKGGANMEVVKPYQETKLSELFQFSFSDLEDEGYLEKKERRRNQLLMLLMCVVGALVLIGSFILNHTHLLLFGLCLFIICPPFIASLLKQFIYQFEMINALKNNVIIKDENSLSVIIEELRKYYKQPHQDGDYEKLNIKHHLGGYKRQEIATEYDCIYESKESLEKVYAYIYRLDHSWHRLRLYSLILKFVLLALLLTPLMSYTLFTFGVFVIEAFIYLNVVKIMDEKV